MTLRELINKSPYKSVFNAIHKAYYFRKDEGRILKADLAFISAWKILCELPPNPQDNWEIHCIDRSTEEESIIDTCYYSKEEDELYALDFVPWSDLIDLEVCSSLPSSCEILAQILWEITFWGFSPEKIQREADKLKE